MNKMQSSRFAARLRIAYIKLNERTHGYLRIFRILWHRVGESNTAQSAASLAFYAFFSLFPLLLVTIGMISFWMANEVAFEKVVQLISQLLPFGRSLIETNLREMMALRGASGSIGFIGYLWSSSSFFSILSRNLNAALHAPARNYFQNRVIAILIVLLLIILFGLSLLSSTLVNVLPEINILKINGIPIQDTKLWKNFLRIIPLLASFVFFMLLYRYVPGKKIRKKSMLITSAFTSLGWALASRIFTWMLATGFVRYEVVYGTIGTILALMFWIYLICFVTLVGAHLSAVLEETFNRDEILHHRRQTL